MASATGKKFFIMNWNGHKNNLRLKISSTDDQSQSDVDTYITPITPISQPGTFGAIEPAMAPVTANFIIPQSEYKWNQIVEIQLPNGKKVKFNKKTSNHFLLYILTF